MGRLAILAAPAASPLAVLLALSLAAPGCGKDDGNNRASVVREQDRVRTTPERQRAARQGPGAAAQDRGRRNTRKLDLKPWLPARTTTYKDRVHRVSITFPANWHRATESLTPRLKKPGGILAVGTSPLRPAPGQACSREPNLPQVAVGPEEALVHLEVQPDEPASPSAIRPPRFRLLEQVRPVEPDRPAAGQVFPWGCLDRVGIAGLWTFFGADGRVFYVTAVAGEDTSERLRRTMLGVLDGLRFGR